MKYTYTLIVEFRGGTYINQVIASNVDLAIIAWIEQLKISRKPIKYLGTKTLAEISQEAKDYDNTPKALDGVDNVWCTSFCTKVGFFLINIIKTFN